MNKKGTRSTNGEGSIYNTIQKIDRKEKRLNFICNICKNCSDWSICNNRIGTKKCEKCKKCTDCLKSGFCDRFYCYEINQAQITINGKQTTVANEKKRKDAVSKKMETESKVLTKSYIKKNNILLPDKIKQIYNEKLKRGLIKANTYNRVMSDLKHIELSDLSDIPMSKITTDMITDFLDEKRNLAQSSIEKIFLLIKIAYNECIDNNEISQSCNPTKNITIISEKETKEVEAFDIDEEIILIEYLKKHKKTLVDKFKSLEISISVKNIILLALYTGMRIGELGSLNYKINIDFKHKDFIVKNTLTRDLENKVIIGTSSKTGERKKRKGKRDIRFIPFSIYDEKEIIQLLEEQIEISSGITKNKNKLLFCRKDGSCIDPKHISGIFKKICRKARLKLYLEDGCSIHMTRHTFATRCIESGIDIFVLAELLGHENTKQIEKTYGHILNKYRNENISKLKNHYIKNNIFKQ